MAALKKSLGQFAEAPAVAKKPSNPKSAAKKTEKPASAAKAKKTEVMELSVARRPAARKRA